MIGGLEIRHMPKSFSTLPLRVNSNRMLDSFSALSLVGATGDGGVSRVAFSEARLAARDWFCAEEKMLVWNSAWTGLGIILPSSHLHLRQVQVLRA